MTPEREALLMTLHKALHFGKPNDCRLCVFTRIVIAQAEGHKARKAVERL